MVSSGVNRRQVQIRVYFAMGLYPLEDIEFFIKKLKVAMVTWNKVTSSETYDFLHAYLKAMELVFGWQDVARNTIPGYTVE